MSIGSAVFLQVTLDSAYTLQWEKTCPPKLPLPMRGSMPIADTWFYGPIRVQNSNSNGIRSVHQFCSAHIVESNRHTQTRLSIVAVWHTYRMSDNELNFVDYTIDLPWRNPDFWEKFHRKEPSSLEITQWRVGGNRRAPISTYPSLCYLQRWVDGFRGFGVLFQIPSTP